MKLLILSFCLLTFHLSVAQVSNPEFDNIAKKFDAGKFESALETAESLMDNDKHRKKPEPYLWASMCFLELSKSDDEKVQDRYKNAVRDALKYGGKAVSKDKNGNIVSENEQYYSDLKKAGVALANDYLAEENVRKAQYTFKQILDFASDDDNVRFAKAITDIKLNSMYEAEKEMKIAFPNLTSAYKDLGHKPDPVSSPLLKDATLYYIDHLVNNNYLDSAKTAVLSARLFFPLDENITKRYNELK